MLERGPGGEASPHSVLSVANNPSLRPLSFPHPPPICTIDGDWQTQVLPGAPGTARQGPTRTIMLVNSGGNATQPRAPGHERPRTAPHAARHGRLSAATRAPGADVPPTTTAGAPGQYCLSAALQAPGHGRPLAITAGVPCRDRLSAAPRAPGDDAALAATAMPPSHHRPSAAPIATAPVPAGLRRLRQGILPRVPANPRTLIYSPAHRDTVHTHTTYLRAAPSPCAAGGPQGGQVTSPTRHSHRLNRHSRESGNPRPPVATGGPQGGQVMPLTSSLRPKPQSIAMRTPDHRANSPSLPGKGPGVRSRPQTTHQVHPAVQVPPRPRSCSTAHTGRLLRPPSRAPPKPTRRKPILASRFPLSTWWRGPGGEAHHPPSRAERREQQARLPVGQRRVRRATA